MSDLDFDPYAGAAREEREKASDWADGERHREQEARDHRDRDAGENSYLPKKGAVACRECGRVGRHRQSCSLFSEAPRHVERVRDAGYDDADPKGAIVR